MEVSVQVSVFIPTPGTVEQVASRKGRLTIALTRLQPLLKFYQRVPATQMISEPKKPRLKEPLVQAPRQHRPEPQLLGLVRRALGETKQSHPPV